MDTKGFPEDLGFRFNPETGEALQSFTSGDDDIGVTVTWKETGWFFHVDNFIDGPGVHQKAGIIAFAKLESAKKLADWLVNKIDHTFQTDVVPTQWDTYKVVDRDGNEVTQWQIQVKDSTGAPVGKLNAGLTISTIIRANNPDFAAVMVKQMLSN